VIHKRPKDTELATVVHRGEHYTERQRELRELIRDLVAEAVATGYVRDDVAPGELATYCINALAAAGSLPSTAAVHRLVAVTLTGLRPS